MLKITIDYNLDSIVTITLTPKNNGTEVTLVHDQFTVLQHTNIFDAMQKGWRDNLHKMAARLAAHQQSV